MANVMFKRGTQSALNGLSSFVDGAFYLTTDTDRLYVAQSSSELVELNKSITIVNNLSDLPTKKNTTTTTIKGSDVAVGQFYYVKAGANSVSGNILAVCSAIGSGSDGAITWTQVNPDTTDGNDYVSDFSITKDTTNSNSSKLIYNWSLGQKDKNDQAISAHALSGSFTISASDVVSLGGIAVDLDAEAISGGGAKIKTGGQGADTNGGKVSLIEGSNIDISVSNNDITITAVDTTYDLTSPENEAKVKLVDSNSQIDSVEFKADDTYLAVDGSTAGEIKYSHKTSGVTAGTYGNSGGAIAHDSGSIKIPKVTVNAAGHVTSISEETFTMPVDNDTTYVSDAPEAGSGTNAGKLTTKIKDSAGQVSSATSGKILYHKITVDGTEVTKYNTESLGSFYSASKIDEKLNAIDAMHYCGTVGGTGATVSALPTTGVHSGDTYKVSADGTYGGQSTHVGDLLIAQGTETSGIITSNLAWTLVPAGDYPDTQYTLSAADNKIILTDSIDSGTQTVEIDAGDKLTATTTGTANQYKITIDHDPSGVVSGSDTSKSAGNANNVTPSYGGTFNVPYVTVDKFGHVTSLANKTVTIPASDDTTYYLAGNNTNKSITLYNDDKQASGSLTFAQGNAITVTMTGNEASTDNAAAENKTLTVKHNDITRTDPTELTPAQLAHAGKFKVITGITSNAQGHITAAQVSEFQLPASDVTSCTANADNNKLSVLYNDSTVGSIQLITDNLSISSSVAENTQNLVTKINFEWGTF